MLNVKLIVIFLLLPLAFFAVYQAWAHQQQSRVVSIKKGGVSLFSAHEAEQIKQVQDR